MDPKYVCVLDLDETCGFYDGKVFHVRPLFKTFIHFLRLIRADIILWSLGTDEYVLRVINGFLPELQAHAVKIFARSEADYSKLYYQYYKASTHVRDLYASQPIVLIAVDDNVSTNMDEQGYDLRIYIKPYAKVNSCDKELLKTMEAIVRGVARLTKLDHHVQRRPRVETHLQPTNEMDPTPMAEATRC
ncbi:hypothetical protein JTE90_011123 [Oedothorax gibbosus]|uniref:FCP1 homology domain-containing protein n=1 Tax=Oedothorax gibbosus TaxID=931172 RepID=A0AAV6TEL6_9ARAC|nr:hypothetical protein JTE90_011123 [Oedothorax gibbosus]